MYNDNRKVEHLFSDIDGTAISEENGSITHKFITRLLEYGCVHNEQAVQIIDMLQHRDKYNQYPRSQVYANKLALLAMGIKGQRQSDIQSIADDVAEQILDNDVFDYVRPSFELLKSQGVEIVAVTASVDEIAMPVCKGLGFDAVYATKLAKDDGIYTGELDGSIISAQEKSHQILKHLGKYASDPNIHTRIMAIGDTINDESMYYVNGKQVRYPIVIQPKHSPIPYGVIKARINNAQSIIRECFEK